MKLKCDNCGELLYVEELETYKEPHGEEMLCCPYCGETDFIEMKLCRACHGEWVEAGDNYCEACHEIVNWAVDDCARDLWKNLPKLDRREALDLMSARIEELWDLEFKKG